MKEISSKINKDNLNKLPKLISSIIQKMKNVNVGLVKLKDDKEIIKEVLKKIKGHNIINFSDFINEAIDIKHIKEMMMRFLNPEDSKKINEIKFLLLKYNNYIKLFNKEFEESKKQSIFEFSIFSLVISEYDHIFEIFENERQKCPDRIDKILFHGTSIEAIQSILKNPFPSHIKRYPSRKFLYHFTDLLDYSFFYGGNISRKDRGKIPKVGDNLTLIASFIYYDKKTKPYFIPRKNQINFNYVSASNEVLTNPDFRKFVGTDYSIFECNQIFPFIGAKLERNEYCVIWKVNNLSNNPVFNNKYKESFNKYLTDRMRYIKEVTKFNIYQCTTSEDALKLIERKKYNKIILISNIEFDSREKLFIDEARKIIGNDVIVLILDFNISELNWIKYYKNIIISDDPNFCEEYLKCFYADKEAVEEIIKSLKIKVEKTYKIKLNFDNNFLYYPNFKEGGEYNDLIFDV